MRRSDIFGDDAALFRPERWLGGDSRLIRHREKVWELSFSHGRFVCLGRPIALMELNKVFVEVRCMLLRIIRSRLTLIAVSSFRLRPGESSATAQDSMPTNPHPGADVRDCTVNLDQ
jgi:hypothetical protein